MSRIFPTLVLIAAASTAALAQETRQRTDASASAESAASVHKNGQDLNIASGTRLAAQLQNTLDVRKARVGDRVVLKTTEAIKSGGQTVVKKGARLTGRVTDVQQSARGSAESHVTLLFDRIESGSLAAPISATVTSITQSSARASADDDGSLDAGVSGSSRTSARTQKSSSGGGLLGSTVGAVGGVVGTTTGVAGDVVSGAGETVGSVGRTLGRVRVTQSASASAEGGSTLSLAGGNLLLEKGTTFHLTLSESASVNNDR